MHDEIEIFLEQFTGRIGCLRRLPVFFDKLIELERSVSTDIRNFKNSIVKTRDHFYFRENRKSAKIIRTLIFAENIPTTRIEITINVLVGRAFRIVTIVRCNCYGAIPENSEGYREDFTTLPE